MLVFCVFVVTGERNSWSIHLKCYLTTQICWVKRVPPTIKDHHKTLAFNLDTVLRREPMLENLKYHKKKGLKCVKNTCKSGSDPAENQPDRTGPGRPVRPDSGFFTVRLDTGHYIKSGDRTGQWLFVILKCLELW